MGEDYWDGGTWVYQASITNGAGGAGVQSYTVVPGRGNEMEVLYGEFFNGDTVGVVLTVSVDDGANELAELMSVTADAASRHSFPHSDVSGVAGTHTSAGARIIVAGTMRLIALSASVAASQDTNLGLACRIRGSEPVVTEVGASTPTITINTEQVF